MFCIQRKGRVLFVAATMEVWPCAGQAIPTRQEEPPATHMQVAPKPYRFYSGLHLASQVYRVTSFTYPIEEIVIRPLYGFVGYQLGPRLAVQVGFLQYNPSSVAVDEVGFNQAGQVVESHAYYDRYSAAVPMLFRYRVARRPIRLHLDVLAGVAYVIRNYQGSYVQSIDGKVTNEVYDYSRARNVHLTAGIGLGFAVTPHVELMAEGTANRNTASLNSSYAKQIMFGVGTGVRYCFNVGKQKE